MWRTTAVTLTAGLALLAACGDDPHGRDRGGSSAVYDEIETSTDCDELQEQFDTAGDSFDRQPDAGSPQAEWSLGFMEAAEDRMEEIGC